MNVFLLAAEPRSWRERTELTLAAFLRWAIALEA
jgi:hypothetical protein